MKKIIINPVSLAKSLISHASVTPIDDGVLPMLANELENIGFECHLLEYDGDDSHAVLNLFAIYGKGGRHICFAGHTDVVPAGDLQQWKFPPFEPTIEDGILYGRGAEDMKSAIAAFAAAASRYIAEHDGEGRISLLITNDEEWLSINGTRKVLIWMKDRDLIPDFAIVGEPTNPLVMGEMAKVGRRGSLNTLIEVEGVQGHVAYPEFFTNPNTYLVEILHKLKNTPIDAGSEFFSPSNLEITTIDVENPTSNLIPSKAAARFNIRFSDKYNADSIKKWVEDNLPALPDDIKVKFNHRISGESFICPPNEDTKKLVAAIEKVCGMKPALTTTGGTSDARYISKYCPHVEFGTTGSTAHKINECVKVEDIEKLSDVYNEFLKMFFAK